MAEQLHMQQSSLSRRLRGELSWRAAEVVAAARALQVHVHDLMPPLEE